MLLLQLTTEGGAIQQVVVEKFPFQIGRSEQNDLQVTDPGVWAEHLILDFHPAEKEFRLNACSEALCFVNGTRVEQQILRNGDLIQIGGCRIVFNLAPPRQGALVLRQALAWLFISFVMATQVLVILWINRE